MEGPESFISDDNLNAIDKSLPFHQMQRRGNSFEPDIIALVKQKRNIGFLQDAIEDTGTSPLNTTTDYVASWSAVACKRELFQNLLDEVACANGGRNAVPSFDGLVISHGQRQRSGARDIENAIVFHNGTEKLAEVIRVDCHKTPKSVHFCGKSASKEPLQYGTLKMINYGANILEGRKILQYGQTNKRGVANQVGTHGEGLKRAIMVALKCGCGVDIYGIFNESGVYTSQHWRFYLVGNAGFVNITPIKPKQRFVGSPHCDMARFEVCISFPIPEADAFNFTLHDYIVPMDHLSSQPRIIMDANLRGKVYAHHFFVVCYKKRCMRYAYDFHMHLSRDRDGIDWSTLQNAVAGIWSSAIVANSDFAKLFFDLISNDENSNYIETQCASLLSNAAKETLGRCFAEKYPRGYPVCAADKLLYKQLAMEHVVCTQTLFGILGVASIEKLISTALGEFIANATPNEGVEFDYCVASLFANIGIGVFFSHNSLNVMFAFDEATKTLYLCKSFRGQDFMRVVGHIACNWLPHFICDFDGTSVLLQLLKQQQERDPCPKKPTTPTTVATKRPRKEEHEEQNEPDGPELETEVQKQSKVQTISFHVQGNAPDGFHWQCCAVPNESN